MLRARAARLRLDYATSPRLNTTVFLQYDNESEQLAVNAFADAVEVIPRTLAENSGLDPIDLMTELKAAHDKGEKTAGVDVFAGKAQDAWKAGIIEPLQVKLQAVSSASEVAIMILRIDDVIAAGKQDSGPKMPSMPNGGGMPDY